GTADEYDLPRLARVQEPLDRKPRVLVRAGGALRKQVDAAMNVGAVLGVEADDGVDDGARLLRRRGVVEVDERLAPDPLLQDREVLPDARDIERVCFRHPHLTRWSGDGHSASSHPSPGRSPG